MKNGSAKQFTVARWTKATFWGWLIGVVFILMLSSFLGSIGIEDMQFYLGVGMGAGVGLAQWWMLRKYVPITQNWIWLSVIGMSAPFAIIDLIPSVESPLKLALSVALGALTVGALQYLLLKKHLTKASLWFWACFIGWTLAVFGHQNHRLYHADKSYRLYEFGTSVLKFTLNPVWRCYFRGYFGHRFEKNAGVNVVNSPHNFSITKFVSFVNRCIVALSPIIP